MSQAVPLYEALLAEGSDLGIVTRSFVPSAFQPFEIASGRSASVPPPTDVRTDLSNEPLDPNYRLDWVAKARSTSVASCGPRAAGP